MTGPIFYHEVAFRVTDGLSNDRYAVFIVPIDEFPDDFSVTIDLKYASGFGFGYKDIAVGKILMFAANFAVHSLIRYSTILNRYCALVRIHFATLARINLHNCAAAQ